MPRLARFNNNPRTGHHATADRVLLYLKDTKSLALQFSGDGSFIVATDTPVADDMVDRKSSQPYVMALFLGTIEWRASKQATVTTSAT
jgi:hypothetical protein